MTIEVDIIDVEFEILTSIEVTSYQDMNDLNNHPDIKQALNIVFKKLWGEYNKKQLDDLYKYLSSDNIRIVGLVNQKDWCIQRENGGPYKLSVLPRTSPGDYIFISFSSELNEGGGWAANSGIIEKEKLDGSLSTMGNARLCW